MGSYYNWVVLKNGEKQVEHEDYYTVLKYLRTLNKKKLDQYTVLRETPNGEDKVYEAKELYDRRPW